jgi:hypothetical protein
LGFFRLRRRYENCYDWSDPDDIKPSIQKVIALITFVSTFLKTFHHIISCL